MIYGRNSDGSFCLVPDADGDIWAPDWPVICVSWFGAVEYARWYTKKTNRTWFLPQELQWEKSARGVDGRTFVWGNGFDPSYCCTRNSHRQRALPGVVQDFPTDESIYGVRGLSGNVMDWIDNAWDPEELGASFGWETYKVSHNEAHVLNFSVVIRGGSWNHSEKSACVTSRYGLNPSCVRNNIGFRLVRKI